MRKTNRRHMTVHHAAPHADTILDEQIRITAGHAGWMRFSAPAGLAPVMAVPATAAEKAQVGEHSYVTNQNSNDVSVIDTLTNTVTATVPSAAKPMTWTGSGCRASGSAAYVKAVTPSYSPWRAWPVTSYSRSSRPFGVAS